jgi:predicted dehydrogenase
MMCHGHESWHPAPTFYYDFGGGPMLDMGPYYITALVNLLGPAKRLCACTSQSFKERIATSKHCPGLKIPVKVETHQAGTIEFKNGAVATVIMSFDIWKHNMPKIQIYGTAGSMNVPDPNGFGGKVGVFRPGNEDWQDSTLSHGYAENMRGIGVADMACALRGKRKHRCNGDLAYHVLEIMTAFETSSKENRFVTLKSSCERPDALPMGLRHGTLD